MARSEQQSPGETDFPELFEPHCGLYPGITSFTPDYDASDYREWVSRSNGDPVPAPLMLVVQDGGGARNDGARDDAAYPLALHGAITREIQLQGSLFDRDRPLEGVVCAPGITAGWSNDALYELSSSIQKTFSIEPAAFQRWCACFGLERPPVARLQLLNVLGFSRIRLGMDVSSPLQGGDVYARAFDQAGGLFEDARGLGYRALALDLVLPAVITDKLANRIETFLAQTQVECVRLLVDACQDDGQAGSPLSLLRTGIQERLGYRHLGLDWYVTGADPSLGSGSPLYWSPLGYTNIRGLDIIGAGPGAVSVLEDASSQNIVSREYYQRCVKQGEIPIERGVELESDDLLRRSVMTGLLVAERFDIESLEDRWGIMFSRYFETEMPRLRELEAQGRLMLSEREIRTLDRSREALMALCRIFDNQERIARVTPLQEVF